MPSWFKSPPIKFDQTRTVDVNYSGQRNQEEEYMYPSNFITTSKYTMITFFPVSLIGQFRRYANIYFLFIAIIQSIPIISPLNPISAIAPLVFVLGLSMMREAMEDIRRHRSDNEVNAMECTGFVNGKTVKTTWADIKVGDMLVIHQDEMFPADIVVLGSSIESGACYIETSSLDGEKNLKPKSTLQETQGHFKDLEHINPPKITLTGQMPKPDISNFEGGFCMPSVNTDNKSLNQKQLLLRGAFLRNTEWIIGGVIYTGMDTKIMRNAEVGRIKQSSIELQMNKLILGILLVQICLCTLSAILSSWWLNTEGPNHWYVWSDDPKPSVQSFLVFFSYFLLYNTMIPISLIVSMEFVKVFQSYFIEKDIDMYVAQRDKFAKANTSTINEELGQVEYIFSDKTGTLTCNQMEFKYCIIGNVLYGRGNESSKDKKQETKENLGHGAIVDLENNTNDDKPPAPATFQHSIFTFKDEMLQSIIQGHNSARVQEAAKARVDFLVNSLDGKERVPIQTQLDLINEYFFLLSSAHECIVQKDKVTGKINYQGPSPDEITLVDAAMNMGFKFVGSSSSQQEFDILGKPKRVQLLNMFEFDSDRKRMSVIIRDTDNKIKLYIKGADNIIKGRLNTKIKQPFQDYIVGMLDEFSRIGLRTLLMAMKVLSEQEFAEFDKKFNSFSNSANRDDDIRNLTDEFERDLYLLGATAVEDKLQPLVPETIADLLKANIKVWMLTGDKMETAENIARSCRLIQGDMAVMRFSELEQNQLLKKIQDSRATYDLCIKEKRKKSFIVEGAALGIIMSNKQIQRQFVKMAKNCDSVVCCRVTPKQKAQVVKLIKDTCNKITLAIGDGANDVNMIQEAHIGVGLYGNEGMRAVQSADFALGEFRCLWRLVLVHGHWSYIRIAEMILYFFYKNMIFTIPQFFFAFFSAYSAQTFFDDWYITFYNLFFTALPLVARATFDQDVNYKGTYNPHYDGERIEFLHKQEDYLKKKFPNLYYVGQQKTIFTIPNFIFWYAQGLTHGIIVFFITLGCFNFEILDIWGMPVGLSAFSITVYTSIIFIVDIKVALYTKFWTCFNITSLIFLSIFIYIIYFIISNFFVGSYSEATPLYLLQTPLFYLMVLVVNAMVFIFDLTLNQIVRELWPTEIDKMLKFKVKLHNIIHEHHVQHKDSGTKGQLVNYIEQKQLQKREEGLQREWGDSFFEDIVEDKHKREKEHNDLQPKSNKPRIEEEEKPIMLNIK